MPILHLLGTGAAVSDPHRTTTMLAAHDDGSTLLIDCGGDAIQRLMQAGLDPNSVEALVVTHEHPDHVSGFPLLMEKVWLAGRRRPLPVVGIAPALEQARKIFEAFDTSGWDGLPAIDWREIPHAEDTLAWEDERWHVTASPVVHAKPTIGLRIESRASGRVLAYSCDTEPTETVARLARDADILVHEATGAMDGHSSAAQAAEIAAEANAYRLLLVHLPPGLTDADLADARKWISRVELGEELGQYDF